MPQIGEHIGTRIELKKEASAVEGQYGPQWELEVHVPWSKYPTRLWVNQSDHPERPQPGQHNAVLEVRSLQDGKDGSAQWHYNYRLVSLGGNAPVPASQPSQAQPQTNQWDERERQIIWGQAVNLAAQCFGPVKASHDFEGFMGECDKWLETIHMLASSKIYPQLMAWRQNIPSESPAPTSAPESNPPQPNKPQPPVDTADAQLDLTPILEWANEHKVTGKWVAEHLPLPFSDPKPSRLSEHLRWYIHNTPGVTTQSVLSKLSDAHAGEELGLDG